MIEHTRSELLNTDYRLSFLTRLIRFYERYIDVLVERGELDEALTVADSIRARVLAERHVEAALEVAAGESAGVDVPGARVELRRGKMVLLREVR